MRKHRIEGEHAANVVAAAAVVGFGGGRRRIESKDPGGSGRGCGGVGGGAGLGWVEAVEPANEGDARGTVRVVLDPLDDAQR